MSVPDQTPFPTTVAALHDGFFGDDRWMQLSPPPPPVSMGLPVLNDQNKVIGMLTTGSQTAGFAITVEPIQALLIQSEHFPRPQTLARYFAKALPDVFGVDTFQQALSADLRGDPAAAWFGLALAYLKLDRGKEMREVQEKLEKLDPRLAAELSDIRNGIAH